MSVVAQLTVGIHRCAERADDLPRALHREAGITPRGPSLPARLARPCPVETAQVVMTVYQIAPQPRRFLATGRNAGPCGCRACSSRTLYRRIAHARTTT
jgi:hypothetical protein